MPILLIPLAWLAVITLVVAACRVAGRADSRGPASPPGQEVLDRRAVPDQVQTLERIAVSQRSYIAAGEH